MRWKTVIGFELYSVSDSGLVKNNETGLILSQGDCGSGYLHVRLHGKYNKLVHRLVAEAFLKNEDGKDQLGYLSFDAKMSIIFSPSATLSHISTHKS